MISDMKPFRFKGFEQDGNEKEEFGMDSSLTSLCWLQKLNCKTGLNKDLQTPTTAPPPRLSLQRDLTSGEWKSSQSLLDQLPSVEDIDAAICKDHQILPDIDWATTIEPKPPHNFATLIYMSMRQTKHAKVTLHDIYSYIQRRFKFYRATDPAWKNSIRHNLTQNKFFKKTMKPETEEDSKKSGGYWTLDINIKNIEDFSRGIWRQSRVRHRPAGGTKSCVLKPVKAPKQSKATKGPHKVGKTSSPKSGRKGSASSTNSSHSSMLSLENLSLMASSKDKDLPSGIVTNSNWNIFDEGESDVWNDIVHNDWEDEDSADIYNSIISGDGADAEMSDISETDLLMDEVSSSVDGGYDSPAAARKQIPSNEQTTHSSSNAFALSEGLAKFGATVSPTVSLSDLNPSLRTGQPATAGFGIMEDLNLEVVGVGISLLPRSDLMSPEDSGKRDDSLINIMPDLNDDGPIPIDWNI